MAKFMLSLRDENFQLLATEAEERGITIQELIRAVIIPDWVKEASPVNTTAASMSLSQESVANTVTTSASLGQTRPIVAGKDNGREQLVQPLNRVRRTNASYNP